jgi:hypothetical protein
MGSVELEPAVKNGETKQETQNIATVNKPTNERKKKKKKNESVTTSAKVTDEDFRNAYIIYRES